MTSEPNRAPVDLEDMRFHSVQNQCFACGPVNPVGLKLHFELTPAGEAICQVVVPNTYEGPPGYVHGGIIATLLDEAMSKAHLAVKVTAMTRKLEVEYLRPVPSGAPIRIQGRVLRAEGRKHWATAEIKNEEGTTLASAAGFFLAISNRV